MVILYPRKPPYGYRIIEHYTIEVPPPYGTGKYYKNKKGGRKCLGYEYGRGYEFGKRVALAQNRAVRATKEPVIEQEWQKYKPKMDNDLITVKVLINGILFKPVLIKTGYKYYSILDKNLITELQFPRVKIPLKLITGFIKENIKEP